LLKLQGLISTQTEQHMFNTLHFEYNIWLERRIKRVHTSLIMTIKLIRLTHSK